MLFDISSKINQVCIIISAQHKVCTNRTVADTTICCESVLAIKPLVYIVLRDLDISRN